MPTMIRWRSTMSSAVSAVSSPTGSPTNASSSSRARSTPSRRRRSFVAPHRAHTFGRRSPVDATNSPPTSDMIRSPSRVLTSSPHVAQASNWALPLRFNTASTRPSPPVDLMAAASADEKGPGVPGSSPRRSMISTRGHAPRSAVRDKLSLRSAAANASSDGAGDTSTHGIPRRRARSMATVLACQVGLRSSWSRSSCSSSTTIERRSGTVPHTADRAPVTTPPRAA